MSEQTIGEYRVGLNFNPSGDVNVTYVKATIAALIDDLHSTAEYAVDPDNEDSNEEVARLCRIAMNKLENAAMWAVKAYTKPQPA